MVLREGIGESVGSERFLTFTTKTNEITLEDALSYGQVHETGDQNVLEFINTFEVISDIINGVTDFVLFLVERGLG